MSPSFTTPFVMEVRNRTYEVGNTTAATNITLYTNYENETNGYYYSYYDYDYRNCVSGSPQSKMDLPCYQLCLHTLLPIICLTGIIGIIITIIVLSRKNMCTSTNSYLISLAAADLIFLLIFSNRFLETRLSQEQDYLYYTIMTYAGIFLDILLLASVWLTVMLALERYIAICHPMRAMAICTVKRARIIIICIVIGAFIMRFPRFFQYKVIKLYDTCLQKEVPFTEASEFGTNITYMTIYGWIVDCTFGAILPFGALLFLNGCLIREIHRSTKYLRYHLAVDSNIQTIISFEEMKITMMLVSIVVVFFTCQAPYVVLSCIKSVNGYSNVVLTDIYYIFNNITLLLLALRSSFNFILFCWFSEKFWNTFKRVFCIKKCIRKIFSRKLSVKINGNSEHNTSVTNRKISSFNTRETAF
ncbi:hypothetical protein CHS0354_012417 [Potamilus streckersoni]|uniref:G-protein coupled receptors family 1 profile domain-containing protein n=1 Tax=Potamilus streckersoni TaxID=2493646 RepID=A0AAE0SFN7_9BIVA|nr:hypothetical protein CHS0354_012417 [Potamilus streckersoni]